MSTIAYQCPCCGAPLAYGAGSGKLECAACGNSYELDALEAMNESQETGSIQFDMPTETFDESEAAQGDRSDASCRRLERVQLDWGPLAEKHRRRPAGAEFDPAGKSL